MAAVAGLRGFWSWYQARLVQQPVRTQVISSGVLWAVGDIIAQTVEGKIQKRSQALRQDGLKGERATAGHAANLDLERVARTSLFGFGFVGPVGHFWYEGLEHLVKDKMKLAPNSVRFVGTKVFADTVLFGPIHLLAFFTYMGLASGKTFEQVKKDIQRDFPPTFMTEGAMWFFVQIANFRLVPVRNQLLVVNLFCILDSAFLSWVKHQDDAPWKRYLNSLVTPGSKSKDD
ncbi:unnamed protein product [Calypogeia fissa]